MSIPISVVPQVQDYLVSQFSAAVTAAGLSNPACEVYLLAPDHETVNDIVTVGGASRQIKPAAMVGGGGQFWRDEKFHIKVEIDCFQPGVNGSQLAVRNRAYQILGILETTIRNDPGLNGLVIQADPEMTDDTPSWDQSHKGARYQIDLHVAVFATL